MELQDYFDIRDTCLPLILQDKINLIQNYVRGNQDQQVALLKLLDKLYVDISSDDSTVDKLIRQYALPTIRRDKLTPKVLAKLGVRLMKLYQVSQDVCPNISGNRTLRGLRYLLYKKYMEQDIGYDQWVDLVQVGWQIY